MVNTTDKYLVSKVPRYNSPLGRMLTLIECPHTRLRYLILDCPTESTLGFYLDEFANLSVHTVVRCCQPTYPAHKLTEQGIQVLDLPFKDGGIPPPHVIQEWLQLVESTTKRRQQQQHSTIAVHCVAGLGRAPVLVAIGLIEMGMKPLDAIEYIRSKRRGAFNKPQIMFLVS
ncbi:unnamed protein product [Absidia cylindrospora]